MFGLKKKSYATPEIITPHEKYPEILSWQEGDEFYCDIVEMGHLLMYFISITQDGFVYLYDMHHQNKYKIHLDKVMKLAINRTAQTRMIDEELKNSDRYMELLSAFQEAVKELKSKQ
jgi:hypothetical protein